MPELLSSSTLFFGHSFEVVSTDLFFTLLPLFLLLDLLLPLSVSYIFAVRGSRADDDIS